MLSGEEGNVLDMEIPQTSPGQVYSGLEKQAFQSLFTFLHSTENLRSETVPCLCYRGVEESVCRFPNRSG